MSNNLKRSRLSILVQKFDLFGEYVSLNARRDATFTTNFGALITLIMVGIGIAYGQ